MRLLAKAKRITCKYCGSSAVVKYGTYKGVQRYFCKVCRRKFVLNDALPKMKTPVRVIAAALSGYYGGMCHWTPFRGTYSSSTTPTSPSQASTTG